jgi:hypothetical protein
MAEVGRSAAEKAMAFVDILFQAAILGLLIWLVYKAYQCGTDYSQCSTFVYNIIRTGTKYDKYTGLGPMSNVEAIDDSKVTSANTCAKWCTKTYGCNGFVWRDNKCSQLTDPSTVLLVPDSADTYVIQDAEHPSAGFIARPVGDDFSVKVSQRLGSLLTATDGMKCAKACFDNLTSNCIGFSQNITTNTCQLVSNVANVVTTTGTQSYVWTTFNSSNYKEAKF